MTTRSSSERGRAVRCAVSRRLRPGSRRAAPRYLPGTFFFRSLGLIIVFVAAGGPDEGRVIAGPAAARSCGPLARAAEDRTVAPVVSCLRGPTRAFAGAAPPGWNLRAFDDAAWTPAPGLIIPRVPASADEPVDPPPQTTAVEVTPGASLFLRRHFDLAADARGRSLQAARSIELRVGYLDGFVAFLNGVEIGRRNLSEPTSAGRPMLPHGREVERIFVPVTAATLLGPKDNVVAVEIRPALGRRRADSGAPAGSLDVTVTSGVRLVRGPYLIAPVDGTTTVAWETDLPATGTVALQAEATAGAAPAPLVRSRAGRPALRQTVRLTGLRPGVRYRYRVTLDGAATGEGQPAGAWAESDWASFEAPPAPGATPLRFVVYGDMRAPGHAAHAKVVAGIVKERPALVLCTGDLVAIGSEESAWQKYFEITEPLGAIAPIVPAFGNHETYWHGTGLAKAWELFGMKKASPVGSASAYTSFDWGGAHFIILDTNHNDDTQRDWLTRDLEAAKKRHARAIFAMCHDGPWSHGTHGGSRSMQREVAPILAAAGVDVLFGGHDHLYERGTGETSRGPLPYMVVGGGGAPLYEPTCQVPGAPPFATPPQAAPPPPGVPTCPPSVGNIVKAYHYVLVEVGAQALRLCPKLPDGSPLEPCIEKPLRQLERKPP